jgi:uncharacterized integral membrane protein
MRVVLQILLALVFVAGGVLFGAFNPNTVHVDFHVFQIPASLGVALLVALFLGAALGGIAVTVGIVWPLQRRLRKLSRETASLQAVQERPTPAA